MGQKFTAFDSNGAITAFYDSVDSPVPAGVSNVIEITQEEWQTCLSQPGRWYVSNGALAQVPPPSAAQQLASEQAIQSAAIDAAYAAAIQQPVSFTTAAGVTTTYQADAASQTLLMQATQGYTIAGEVPAGFYWKAADNSLVTFTLADLRGLYSATLAQGWTAFRKRTALKQQIAAVSIGSGTIDQALAAVKAIGWD